MNFRNLICLLARPLSLATVPPPPQAWEGPAGPPKGKRRHGRGSPCPSPGLPPADAHRAAGPRPGGRCRRLGLAWQPRGSRLTPAFRQHLLHFFRRGMCAGVCGTTFRPLLTMDDFLGLPSSHFFFRIVLHTRPAPCICGKASPPPPGVLLGAPTQHGTAPGDSGGEGLPLTQGPPCRGLWRSLLFETDCPPTPDHDGLRSSLWVLRWQWLAARSNTHCWGIVRCFRGDFILGWNATSVLLYFLGGIWAALFGDLQPIRRRDGSAMISK